MAMIFGRLQTLAMGLISYSHCRLTCAQFYGLIQTANANKLQACVYLCILFTELFARTASQSSNLLPILTSSRAFENVSDEWPRPTWWKCAECSPQGGAGYRASG